MQWTVQPNVRAGRTSRTRRSTAWLAICAAIAAAACVGHPASPARAASSVGVAGVVATATTLDASACGVGSGSRAFTAGTTPGQDVATPQPCRIAVTTNVAATSVQVRQADGAGRAMYGLPDGRLDTTFGAGTGTATRSTGVSYEYSNDVERQSDGKVIVGGATRHGGNAGVLARYTAAGAPDLAFAGDGHLELPTLSSVSDVAIAADDTIYVSGSSNGLSPARVMVLHLLADGTFDATWNGTGSMAIQTGTGATSPAGLELQPDGKLVVGINATRAGNGLDFGAVRLLAAGGYDTSFGSGGTTLVAVSTLQDSAMDVRLAPSGKIIIVGYTKQVVSLQLWNMAIVRLDTAGAVDTTFHADGIATVQVGTACTTCHSQAFAVVVRADERVVLVGQSNHRFAMAALTSTGDPDTTFNTTGDLTTVVGTSRSEGLDAVLLADGRIIVGGYAYSGGASRQAFAMYATTGALDATFGTAGKYLVGASSQNDWSSAVVPDGAGGLLSAGGPRMATHAVSATGSAIPGFAGGAAATSSPVTTNGDDNPRSIARRVGTGPIASGCAVSADGYYDATLEAFTDSGSPDLAFGTGGRVVLPAGAGYDCFDDVVVQPDGRIVAAGETYTNWHADVRVARFLADGTLDPSFGTGGQVILPVMASANDGVADIELQPDGTILLGGWTGSPYRTWVGRLTTSGALDSTFGTGGTTTFTVGTEGWANSLRRAADGSLLVAGVAKIGTDWDGYVARLTTAGMLDVTFSGDGIAPIEPSTGYDEIIDVEETALGIVVAGSATVGGEKHLFTSRVTPAGAVDAAYGTGGAATLRVADGYATVRSAALEPSGSIFVGGYAWTGSTYQPFAARLASSGAPDPSIGGVGWRLTPGPAGDSYTAFSAEDADGTVTVVGSLLTGGSYDIVVQRLRALSVDNFAGAVPWQSASAGFGACLEDATGPSPTLGWSEAADGSCGAGDDADPWLGVASDALGPTAEVAELAPGTTTLDLRFGWHTVANQPAGSYVAPLVVDIVAPAI